jgi:periplasmic protein CpxP/Spy
MDMTGLSPLKIALFTLAVGGAVASSGVAAHDREAREHDRAAGQGEASRHHGGMHRMWLRGLDLTEAQQTQIRQLFERRRQDKQRPSEEQREAHKAQMLALITAPQFDEIQAEQLISERQQAHKARAMAQLQLQQEIYQLLTQKQQVKFREGIGRRGGMSHKD